MSSIALFHRVPASAIDGLRDAAVPKKQGLFKKPKDEFWDFLAANAVEVTTYEWSGYVLITLLTFLEEREIDLLTSDKYEDLATFLVQARDMSVLILTPAHRAAYLERMSAQSFSDEELAQYYNEFNESSEPDAAESMRDGIRALVESLDAVGDASIVLVSFT